MTVITLKEAFSAPVITKVISELKTPASRLQEFLGMSPGGPAVQQVSGHYTGWDIFNRTRTLAKGRAAGTGPSTASAHPIGHVAATMYRSHEKIHLPDEKLFNLRGLGENWGVLETKGQKYLAAQERNQAQRIRNTREFMVSRMLQGKFDLLNSGDDWYPVEYGDGHVTVDFRVPDGNRAKLNMLGAGDILGASWATAATGIIGDLFAINKAFEQLHGRPLRHVWCNSTVIQYVMNNTGMKAVAGTSNVVFDSWQASPQVNAEGIQDTGHMVVFKAVPWLVWHVYDAGLEVGTTPTFTQFLDDTHAIFLPDPDPDWCELHEGSELIRENRMSQPEEQFGIYGWSEPTTQPSGQELLTLDNCVPALYVPKCVAYGTVVY